MIVMPTIKQIISLITTYETEVIIVVIAIIGLFLIAKKHFWLFTIFTVSTSIICIDQFTAFIVRFQQLF